MGQSSQSRKTKGLERAVVVQRDHELDDVVALLQKVGVETDVRSGNTTPAPGELEGAVVVIASGARLAEGNTPNLSLWPRTIAIVDHASKTLAAHLTRIGVRLLVRRPIHPLTLRLLLLHEVYRGPERRKRNRVSVGHPIRIGGLLKSKATLLELSNSGARVSLVGSPKVGSTLKLLLGKDLTRAKPLKLQTRVVRCIRASEKNGRKESEVGVEFVDAHREARTIASLLDRFARGPARWAGRLEAPKSTPAAHEPQLDSVDPNAETRPDPESPLAQPSTPAEPTPTEGVRATRALPPSRPRETPGMRPPEPRVSTEASAEIVLDEVSDASESDDRRQDPRVPYDRRIVALGEEAARVLVGRDLSVGGMRIAPCDLVEMGDTIRIALHSGAGTEPVVVMARAMRDEGDAGIVLAFDELSTNQQEHLEKIIGGSHPIEGTSDEEPGDAHGPIVMSEMLETVSRGAGSPDA